MDKQFISHSLSSSEDRTAPVTGSNENIRNYFVQVRTSQQDGQPFHRIIYAPGDDFLKAISGNADAIKLLLKAVNNRTVERDYFKLYCNMLDSSITEEEFDREIESNESSYVVDESGEPDDSQIKTALELAAHIKGVDSLNDFTALFSFNPKNIEAISQKSNG